MKCLCGYEYKENKRKTKHNKPFDLLMVDAVPQVSGIEWRGFCKILYVCPECGTVKEDKE